MASQGSLVNWKIVDAELGRVPNDFKDPKFYALKHVVEILTSSNPQGMVAQLRDQEQRLVTLVDQMVQGYHSGFAKSIQNYSQILQLFGDAKEQVDGLKKALADASRQLSAQSRTLQQQWRKTLALECSLRLLDDMQLVADAPGCIDEALAAKDWSSAVQLLLEACSKLAMDELATVGALRKLRQDMLAICLAIQVQLLEELHSKVYASSSTALQQQQYNDQAVQPMSPGRQFRQQSSQQRSQTPPRGSGSPLRGSPRGSPRTLGSPSGSFSAAGAAGAGQSVMEELRAQQQRGLSRLSQSVGGSSPNLSALVMPAFVVEALQEGPSSTSGPQQQQQQQQRLLPARAANVAELVACLQQLDALEEAKVYLLLHARSGIRRMVLEVVDAWAVQEEAQQQLGAGTAARGWSGLAVLMPHSHAFGTGTAAGSSGSSSSKHSWAVQPAVQLSAQRLLTAVFDACLRALANLGTLLHEIADASSRASSGSGSSRDAGRSRLSVGGQGAAAAAGTKPPAVAGLRQLKQQLQQQGGSLLSGASSSSGSLAADFAAAAAVAGGGIGGSRIGGPTLHSAQSELLPGSSATAAGFMGGLGLNRVLGSSGNLLALAGSGGSGSAGQQQDWLRSGVLDGKDVVEYLRLQYGHVWNEIQEEVLLLLSELLRASLRSGSAAAAPSSASTRQGGWLADFAELGEKARGQLLQATSSTSLAATQVLSSLSSGNSAALAAAAAGASSSSGGVAAGGGPSIPGTVMPLNPGLLNPAGFGSVVQGSKLSFSFELTAAELVPALTAGHGAASAAAAAGAAAGGVSSGGGAHSGGGMPGAAAVAAGALSVGAGKESLTYAGLLKRGLGDFAGGPYLTPAVFLAVSNFVSDALIVISDASLLALTPPPSQQQQQQQAGAPAAASGSGSPSQTVARSAAGGSGFGVQHQQAEAQQGLVLSDPRLNSMWLRQSVEEFVLEGFLPQVWVDLRGRCTAALEDPEACRPQHTSLTGFSSSSSSSLQHLAANAAAAGGSAAASATDRAAAAMPPPPQSVIAAAAFAVQVLQEVVAWLPAMPVNAAGTLSGVMEAILSQVLEALTAQAATCLAGTKAGRLALMPQLALLMATEPDALLLSHEDPVAFYVPPAAAGTGDSGGLGFGCWSHAGGFDCSGFQQALKAADKPYLVPGFHRPPLKLRGLGLEGEPAAEEALLFTLRERPGAPDQLLVGSRPATLAQLAALSESCDWVADCLNRMAAAAAGGQLAAGSWLGCSNAAAGRGAGSKAAAAGGAGAAGSSRRAGGGGLARRAAAGAAAEDAAAVSSVLQQLADRYRSFGGACSRSLRLDLLLMAARQLYALSAVSHICEEEDVMEAHPSIGGLARLAARAAEDLSPHLSPAKMNYVFGPVAGAAARYLMWVLEDIGEMNAMGVERMIRSLALLQSHLCGPGALLPGAANTPAPAGGAAEVSRAYDRAKQYYTLVGLPAEEVVRLAADRPGRFSVAEWEALLLVHVPGRAADERQLAELHRALDKHYHLSAGQKVAEFFEGVKTTVQAPVQNFTGNVSAGFKGGFTQAKALLNKAAASVSEAATSVGAAAAAAAKSKTTGAKEVGSGSTSQA